MTPSRADRSGGPGRAALPRLLMRLFGFRICAALAMIARTRSPGIVASSHPRPPVNRGTVFLLAAMGAILLNAPPRDQNATRATTEWRPVRRRERPSDTYEACQKPAIWLTCRMAGRPTRSRYLRRGLVIARGWRGKLARHMRQVGSAAAGYHALWPSWASAAGCATALAAGRLEISSCSRPRTSRPPRRHTS